MEDSGRAQGGPGEGMLHQSPAPGFITSILFPTLLQTLEFSAFDSPLRLILFLIIYCMCMRVHDSRCHGVQKRASDLLQLEL